MIEIGNLYLFYLVLEIGMRIGETIYCSDNLLVRTLWILMGTYFGSPGKLILCVRVTLAIREETGLGR